MKHMFEKYILIFLLMLTIASWFNFGIFDSMGINAANVKSGCNEVRALYLALLQREPDPSGLRVYCEAYESGSSIKSLAESLMSSAEFNSAN